MTGIGRWDWAALPFRGWKVYLDERMRELASYLERTRDTIEYGPLAGQLYPVTFGYNVQSGLSAGVVDTIPIPFQGTPVAFAASIESGGVTVQVNDDAGSVQVLAANESVATTLNRSGTEYFHEDAARVIGPDLELEIISVDSGTPVHIRAVLVLKNLTQVGELIPP